MKFFITFITALVLSFPLKGFAQGRNQMQDPQAQQGNPTREFVMSCTYGVLAGTLVGAASLAFTKKPSESMGRVARGASLGLYTGILLGLYVVYVVPSMESTPEEEDPVVKMDKLRLWAAPRFDSGQLDGVDVSYVALRF